MVKSDVFSMVGGLGGDFYKDIYEPKLFGMHSGSVCVVGMQELRIPTLKCRFYLFVGWGLCTYRVNRVVFSMFGGLGGDFCKDIYGAKLFGMHIGSVLGGFDAGNVNTDAKLRLLGLETCTRRGVKNDDFRCLEALEGTFVRTYMRQSCLGCMVEGFV